VGLYRFNAVARLFESRGISVAQIDARVRVLQDLFLKGLDGRPDGPVNVSSLICPGDGLAGLGHFLTFRQKNAGDIAERLAARNVIVDHRGDRLRFGFGIYQDEADVQSLLACLDSLSNTPETTT